MNDLREESSEIPVMVKGIKGEIQTSPRDDEQSVIARVRESLMMDNSNDVNDNDVTQYFQRIGDYLQEEILLKWKVNNHGGTIHEFPVPSIMKKDHLMGDPIGVIIGPKKSLQPLLNTSKKRDFDEGIISGLFPINLQSLFTVDQQSYLSLKQLFIQSLAPFLLQHSSRCDQSFSCSPLISELLIPGLQSSWTADIIVRLRTSNFIAERSHLLLTYTFHLESNSIEISLLHKYRQLGETPWEAFQTMFSGSVTATSIDTHTMSTETWSKGKKEHHNQISIPLAPQCIRLQSIGDVHSGFEFDNDRPWMIMSHIQQYLYHHRKSSIDPLHNIITDATPITSSLAIPSHNASSTPSDLYSCYLMLHELVVHHIYFVSEFLQPHIMDSHDEYNDDNNKDQKRVAELSVDSSHQQERQQEVMQTHAQKESTAVEYPLSSKDREMFRSPCITSDRLPTLCTSIKHVQKEEEEEEKLNKAVVTTATTATLLYDIGAFTDEYYL
jgi:hypothetical protein